MSKSDRKQNVTTMVVAGVALVFVLFILLLIFRTLQFDTKAPTVRVVGKRARRFAFDAPLIV